MLYKWVQFFLWKGYYRMRLRTNIRNSMAGQSADQPADLVGDRLLPREHLGLTVLFDHDVTDGAPVARFIGRLQELMETAYGLA
jgi:pyruvate/2-oxoglutarate dehydrogenase complex dihydrolipoamide acyltransferase (E2) component